MTTEAKMSLDPHREDERAGAGNGPESTGMLHRGGVLLESGLRRSARLFADKVALIDGEERLTYAEFAARVDRLASALRGAGLQKGDRVAVLMLNTSRYMELYYGVNAAGGVVVPLNFRLAGPEIKFIVDDCAAKFLFVTREFAEAASQLQQTCPSLETVVHAEDGPAPQWMVGYEELLAAAAPERPPVEVAETDLAGIFYTGGTTGMPKGVMLTQRNLADNAYRMLMQLGYRENDVYLHAAPMFHLADGSSTFAITYAGGTHAHVRAFEPTAVLEAVERDHVTCGALVPTMIMALINHPDVSRRDLSSLRLMLYGASPIAADVLREAMDLLPCDFIQGYGMTEAAPILTFLTPEDHRAGLAGGEKEVRRLRSAGRAAIGIEMKVLDEKGREAPPGTVGEVTARGANVMRGYWRRPEATGETLRKGWYRTGDLATMDEDGYLYIVDRKKDMIVSGGENVYSVEVENALYGHEAVLECAVIGVPDEKWGEAVKALVVLRPGHEATEADLIEHCGGRIGGYKAPKSVDFADSLPKSGAGKILKRELRETYWQGQERRVH